jgi:hypothetical protein
MAGVKGVTKTPVTFSMKLMETICARVAQGDNLNQISKEPGFPTEAAVRQWVAADREGCASMYARAREQQMEWWADDIIRIADSAMSDYESVNAVRVAVDARKWAMSKLAPKRFGDRIEHAGGVTIRHEDDLRKLDELDKLK